MFARYLHEQSPRANSPFIGVNIAGLMRTSVEAELFGSEHQGRVYFGAVEQANGGTLLLKDIADLELGVQARLLNVLESQSLLRVDGRESVSIDVRVVVATRHDLKQAVADGTFRDDLYYHLNVLPITIPALREHLEDVPDLLDYYLDLFATQEGLPQRRFSNAALSQLRAYHWPGNVRELKNLVQRLLILGNGETIDSAEVSQALGQRSAPSTVTSQPDFEMPFRAAREQFEKNYLEYQLQLEHGNVSRVAEKIGLERTHLHRKLRALGIDPKLTKQASR